MPSPVTPASTSTCSPPGPAWPSPPTSSPNWRRLHRWPERRSAVSRHRLCCNMFRQFRTTSRSTRAATSRCSRPRCRCRGCRPVPPGWRSTHRPPRSWKRCASPSTNSPDTHPRPRSEGSLLMSSPHPLPADRTAVITGGASPRGIGRATADRLARDGWSVAILDIDGVAAKLAAAEVADKYSVATLGVAADISDGNSVQEAISQVEAALPPIIGLANVAGVSSPTEFMDVTPAEWDRVFNVNMRGTYLVTQRVLPSMIAASVGRIVSVSSISAQRGGGTYSKVPYSASKAAVIGFSRALAREMGPHNITVNSVAPGPIDTEIMGGTLTDERKAQMSADIPLGRVGTVQDVAALLTFLMSEDAGYITAATYDVNGGLQIS